ncbi:Clp protease ClpP [Granulicatella sp. zg-ZJ]|uniref:head maturation protease, ClpP-related n=1 Tax=Granulicatella sp. zg-ZJ TaxID=2678504 RepID=UPI0013D12D01|nr:head maturation protease, ClpP-related [Granulicatella sp. zg-ZJ]NEW62288.1 Clp protease ClpP [Granulicatella sp. zg-ZJ]
MPVRKFWNWKTNNKDEHILFLNGTIAEESWFDDDVTPRLFKSELDKHQGDIAVWINSPGGDCIAAAQIYNMLMDHKGEVVIKIDGIAASAASVIAMAGTKVLMSPVSMMMIHNPMTIAFGDKEHMKQAISMLDEVKESIMNAYEIKTGLNRQKLSNMMDGETWMNVHKAIELGFCDGLLEREGNETTEVAVVSNAYSKMVVENSLKEKLVEKCHIQPKINTTQSQDLLDRLNLIKNWR